MREGSSVPPPPVFLRPRVCFKLLQALQPRLREREAPGKGRGEGGLVLPFESVCVGRGMIRSLAFHTAFKTHRLPRLQLRMLVCLETRGFIVACIPERGFSWLYLEAVLFELAVIGRKEGGSKCCALLFFSCTGRKKLRSLSSSSESAVVTVC